jgi:hypothetical protein
MEKETVQNLLDVVKVGIFAAFAYGVYEVLVAAIL